MRQQKKDAEAEHRDGGGRGGARVQRRHEPDQDGEADEQSKAQSRDRQQLGERKAPVLAGVCIDAEGNDPKHHDKEREREQIVS
ncbi:MAG: hypothetical protein ACREJ0_26615, partial [Geminicoccaceae bacterium]